MVNPQMVMYEEEFNQIQTVVDRLVRDANAKVVFIVDKNGQLIAASGDIDNVDDHGQGDSLLPIGQDRGVGGDQQVARPLGRLAKRRLAGRAQGGGVIRTLLRAHDEARRDAEPGREDR